MKTIFAISGSLRVGSSNHHILEIIGKMIPANINYIIYNGLSRMPAFDPDLDSDSPPGPVSDLREQLAKADGIIICTPEYAHGVPGALKNALDWMVSSASFSGKPTALITASTGGEDAHKAMIKILNAIDVIETEETTLLISFIRSKMDGEGNIKDKKTLEKLKSLLDSLTNKL